MNALAFKSKHGNKLESCHRYKINNMKLTFFFEKIVILLSNVSTDFCDSVIVRDQEKLKFIVCGNVFITIIGKQPFFPSTIPEITF